LGSGPRRLGTTILIIAHCASVKAWRCVTASFDHTELRQASTLLAMADK
jgi:hypothetical protein